MTGILASFKDERGLVKVLLSLLLNSFNYELWNQQIKNMLFVKTGKVFFQSITFNLHIPVPGSEHKKMKLGLVIPLNIFKILSQGLMDSSPSSNYQKIFSGLDEMLKSMCMARNKYPALVGANKKRNKVLLDRFGRFYNFTVGIGRMMAGNNNNFHACVLVKQGDCFLIPLLLKRDFF